MNRWPPLLRFRLPAWYRLSLRFYRMPSPSNPSSASSRLLSLRKSIISSLLLTRLHLRLSFRPHRLPPAAPPPAVSLTAPSPSSTIIRLNHSAHAASASPFPRLPAVCLLPLPLPSLPPLQQLRPLLLPVTMATANAPPLLLLLLPSLLPSLLPWRRRVRLCTPQPISLQSNPSLLRLLLLRSAVPPSLLLVVSLPCLVALLALPSPLPPLPLLPLTRLCTHQTNFTAIESVPAVTPAPTPAARASLTGAALTAALAARKAELQSASMHPTAPPTLLPMATLRSKLPNFAISSPTRWLPHSCRRYRIRSPYALPTDPNSCARSTIPVPNLLAKPLRWLRCRAALLAPPRSSSSSGMMHSPNY